MIGLGPGAPELVTPQAAEALAQCQVVLGYRSYVEQARPFLRGQRVEASGMTQERQRADRAIDLALAGQRVVLVSGGDPGIYAMAGLVLELAARRKLALGQGRGALAVSVLPGVPALAAGAALLGAPLMHDFACISLSDRLTPWELIEKRLEMAARADLVLVLYNPRSRGRPWQLGRALEIIAGSRGPHTPVGIVSGAFRKTQRVELVTLERAAEAPADMSSTVFVGNSQSFAYQGRLITPRGYLPTEKN